MEGEGGCHTGPLSDRPSQPLRDSLWVPLGAPVFSSVAFCTVSLWGWQAQGDRASSHALVTGASFWQQNLRESGRINCTADGSASVSTGQRTPECVDLNHCSTESIILVKNVRFPHGFKL